MKKFLISFIIGVVFMAVGTTSLIFEIGDFERVRIKGYADEVKDYYQTQTMQIKNAEPIDILFEYDGDYDIIYDDDLKDEIKIMYVDGMEYDQLNGRIYMSGYGYHDSDWEKFEFLLDGIKKRKLYEFTDSSVIITISHENRNRLNIHTNAYNDEYYQGKH